MPNLSLSVLRRPQIANALGESSNALNLLLLGILARLLGVEPFGHFIAVLATASILGQLIEFGFPAFITRSVARDRGTAWHELTVAFRFQMRMGVPMLALLYGYMHLANMPSSVIGPGLLIGASIFLRSLKSNLRGVCRGLQEFSWEAFFLWTERAGLLIFCLAALWTGGGFGAVCLVFFIVRAVDLAFFLTKLRRSLGAQPNAVARGSATLSAVWPFAMSGLLWHLYYQVDTTMLSLLSTLRDTGLYGAIYRFVDVLQVIPRLVISVSFPAMAVAWIQNQDNFKDTFERLQRLLSSVTFPVLLILIVESEWLFNLTFGPDYAAAAPALCLILLGTYFACHSVLLDQTLVTSGQEVKLASALLLSVLFNIAINLILIPRYGYMGAAFATLVTEFLYFAVLTLIARLTGSVRNNLRGIGGLTGAAALVLVVWWRIRQLPVPI